MDFIFSLISKAKRSDNKNITDSTCAKILFTRVGDKNEMLKGGRAFILNTFIIDSQKTNQCRRFCENNGPSPGEFNVVL